MLDDMFVSADDNELVVRAADDRHRAELLNEIEEHVRRANAVIQHWNSDGLQEAVRREVARQRRERESPCALLRRTG